MVKRGGNAKDDIKDAYADPEWKSNLPMKPDSIEENYVMGMVQAHQRGRLPPRIVIPTQTVVSKVMQELFKAGGSRWEISPLGLFNKLEHWMEQSRVFNKWGDCMDLEFALFNVADLMEEEENWKRPSREASGKGESYRTWKRPRFINKVFVSWALVASLMWARPKEAPIMPPNVNKVLDWIEFNIDREYKFYGKMNQVFKVSLFDFMASLGSWLSESPDYNAWATIMDSDAILLGCIRWMDRELRHYEDASKNTLKEQEKA